MQSEKSQLFYCKKFYLLIPNLDNKFDNNYPLLDLFFELLFLRQVQDRINVSQGKNA